MEDRSRPADCCQTGSAEKVLDAPRVFGDYEAYDCPITGRRIEGKKQHEENLRKHGCRLLEPGESRDYMKNFEKRKQEDLEKTIDKVVDQAAREIGLGG